MVQKNSVSKKLLIICGPTASGKTALAVECAKLLDTEIISADSLYIYKNLDIGTAKPTVEERQGIKHHLIDVVSPFEEFSVSDYKKLAEEKIKALHEMGKIPIICGGTGFYINSLLYDLSYGNSCANVEVREEYKRLAEQNGNEFVYEILKVKDPESANKLHANDLKRVIRALEIYHSGIKKSDIKDEFVKKYDYVAYSIDFPRETLYKRINERVDAMINEGLIEEVKCLNSMGVDSKNQCMQGIGYKEILDFLNGNLSLNEAIDLIKLNTRHYAKRQITFFKRLEGINYLMPEPASVLARKITEEL